MDFREEFYFRRRYNDSFKIKVCEEYMESDIGMRELAAKHNLSGHSLIHDWLRRFDFVEDSTYRVKKPTFTLEEINSFSMSKTEKDGRSDFDRLQLEKRITELEQQLKEAQMKAIAYSAMVDIAEKEFKIPIRKKLNTKPSKK